MADREELRKKFLSNRKAIEGMIKQYKYKQELKHADNMEVLCSCLESVLDVDDLSDFTKYLCDEEHLPIEINFRVLRIQKLQELFQDWLIPRQNTIAMLEQIHTCNFRNILFKAILLDEKTVIDEYFSTISNENRLKGFDLYQLITNLLSPYYLYQNNSDNVVFFDKINSFETFLGIVESFIYAGRNFCISKSQRKGDSYIYRQQFQSLIQHWENINPQLTILQNPKKNIQDNGVQTNIFNQSSIGIQTDRENQSNILNLVNHTLHNLNINIQRQDNPTILNSLNNMLQAIRKQKVVIAEFQERRRYRNLYNYQIYDDIVPSETNDSYHRRNNNIIYPSSFDTTPRSKSPIRNQPDFENNLKKIYNHLCQKSSSQYLNSNQLQIFFYHLGLVSIHQGYLLNNLLKNGLIQYAQEITYLQFKGVIKQLLKESKQLRNSNLKQYINEHIIGKNKLPIGRKNSKCESEYMGLLQNNQRKYANRMIYKGITHTEPDGL